MDSPVSQKPHKASEEEKKKRKRKKKSKQTITRAVTHIRLLEANAGKLSTLDALMTVYLELCQQYTTLFCQAESKPDKWSEPVFETELSDRLHRVAMQQAAGIARSFRTNRTTAYQAYLQDMAAYAEAKAQAEAEGRMASFKRPEPTWTDWNLPVLRVPVMQANANVVVVEPSTDSTFDYWLRISTLDKGNPLRVPVKLASYHKKALAGKPLNTSTTLSKRKGVWWLTLSFDEEISLQTATAAPVVGVDVGIANFITTSTGQSYGTFHGALARKHRHDRRKRRNKAKLRACLQKKGVPKAQLPSTSSATGQRLSRHVRQEINRAINQVLDAHPEARLVYENLSVASMRFHARSMNAYLYASQLGHIPDQLAWAAAKRGMAAHTVNPAYSSQECPRCHFVSRANRPDQQTFRCVVCGYQAHADHKAALVLAARWGDQALAACKTKEAVKALLLQRHESWKKAQAEQTTQRVEEIGPALQLSFWDGPERFLEIS
jgi:hypothetical protein